MCELLWEIERRRGRVEEIIEILAFELSVKIGLQGGKGVSAPGSHLCKDMKRKKLLENIRIMCDIGCSRKRGEGKTTVIGDGM